MEVGGQLPAEVVLAERMEVSRTIVRSALHKLDAENLILWEGRRKTLVKRPDKRHRLSQSESLPTGEELERRFLEWILHFDVPAGTSLNIAQLSRQFGVPAHSLQAFLSGLSRFGLVERRAKGGWILSGFTAEFAVELSDFRLVLEMNAVRHLLSLPEDHQIWGKLKEIRKEHEDLRRDLKDRYHDFSTLDEKFHTTINSVVKNRFVLEAQKLISLIFHYHYMWDKRDEQERNAAAIEEHLDWIDAMLAQDRARSEEAALNHLRRSKETLLASLKNHKLG
ncbi:MAG: GntR family transcriptional regulator [Roseibium album]|nr:GntR family transcriptional regulator [Roseibium album]MBG6144806.1 DNA-binding GntR family transcriptional regulator [Labrenzia sp. EL_142]MBG6156980.1 DNA-binding GntR family transcriptional regulator [Labrenzia sp. EL_162]MBG6163409.1 DNA-binding GntR family transcriptional regulator [Labrenzia sp. EL_195]MBG6172230.1 DNA-binding GntR family transcriptional regulator [Labrenzia sp. EL_132]MBG6195079.1 DNA-binding GntR family transcriptional regulator [Labrenzia sp. EL_159]MBG6203340.1 D